METGLTVGHADAKMRNMLLNTEIVTGGILRHLSDKEVCKILNISRPTLRNWRNVGKIEFYQLGENTSSIWYEVDKVEKARIARLEELRLRYEDEIAGLQMSAYDYLEKAHLN